MHISTADADLLKEALFCDDPLAQPDLVEYIPEGVDAVRILNRYNYRTEHVRCAYCGRTLHYKGVTVELSNGKRVLVGHICGGERFERSWDDINDEFKRKEQRRRYLLKVAPLARVIDDLLACLETWRAPIRKFEVIRGEFRHLMRGVYDALEEGFVRHDGKLVVIEKQRDRIAEQRRAERNKKDDSPIYKRVAVAVMTMSGKGFFVHRSQREVLADTIAEFAAIKKIIEKRQRLSDAELARISKAISEAKRDLPRIKACVDDLWSFAKPEHMARVADWLSRTHDSWNVFVFVGGSLRIVDRDDDEVKVQVDFLTEPLDLDMKALEVLDAMRATAEEAVEEEHEPA